MRIDIRLEVKMEHARNPHADVCTAIRCLERAVQNSTVETPALGGVLRDETGRQVGSYVVEFPR